MKIQVLGCSGSELPGHNLSSFLVDDFILMDAGTIGQSLGHAEEKKIKHILVTHTHLDHIKGIPFLVDNLVNNHLRSHITIVSGKAVLNDLKNNIFNNRIWPDFTRIFAKKNAAMTFREIPLRKYLMIGNYKIYAEKVNHTVPAYGYIIEDHEGNALVYTGDTGPTEGIWKRMKHFNVKALIVEVSFPNSMKKLALLSRHLTPALLSEEIEKMTKLPEKIYITHVKPHYMETIKKELKSLKFPEVNLLSDNTVILI